MGFDFFEGDDPMVHTHFKEGIDAFERGILHSACPYRFGSPACEEWGQGWTAGLKAKHGDQDAKQARPHEIDPHEGLDVDEADAVDRDILGDP